MILEVCITLAVCIGPAVDPPPTEPALLAHADQAQERQALREIAHAYDVVHFVDAYTAPEPKATTARQGSEVTETRRLAPHPSPGPVTGQCGGDLPDCSIMQCESGGNPTAQNPTSSASGLWQIIDSTWGNYGGYPTAASAPVEVQNAKARQLWANGAGAGHWAQCR